MGSNMKRKIEFASNLSINIRKYLLNNLVLLIASVLALASTFFVHIDKYYLEYLDYRTLSCLFLMSLVIAALRNIHFFRILARKIINIFKNTRSSITALVLITYIGSMLIANDIALITFLPLGIIVLKSTGKERYMIFTFLLQNLAANLGGMITPFGNPQNLYLYNYYEISNLEFIKIMAIPTISALILILICCVFIKKESLELIDNSVNKLDLKRTFIYLSFFVYFILIVFRIVPYWTGFLITPFILLLDHKSFMQVDYGLILTFVMFFIFTSNLSRINSVHSILSNLVNNNTLLTAVISCQLISNVPSAILLSKFTNNYKDLLVAVNIAGCGTLISSMASVITFKTFVKEKPGQARKYLLWFTIINLLFLIILYLISAIL